jgi:amidase
MAMMLHEQVCFHHARVFGCVMLLAACVIGEAKAQAPADAQAQIVPHQPQTGPLDLQGRTLADLSAQLQAGHLTSVQIVKYYLDRIDEIDRNGPKLQAVIAINKGAMDAARALDAERKAGRARGPLHGMPLLIKDNIETLEPIPTTAGSLALADNITHRDAPLVARLRAAGAIILGKTNLSEWANYRSVSAISAWSGVGGLTRNPYGLDRTPCGSSSGSGAGVAASLAAGAIGTETDGSVTCPASMNGIVGLKPTLGLVSRTHIVPIASSQDTAGPMAHSVTDVAMLLSVIAGSDPDDPATVDADTHKTDYTAVLKPDALRGKRLGVMRFEAGFNPQTDMVFAHALDVLRAAGADLVEIDKLPGLDAIGDAEKIVLSFQFKAGINGYLATTPKTVASRTLADLIAFNNSRPARELGLFGQELFERSQATAGLDDPAYRKALAVSKMLAGQQGIDMMLAKYHVDALVAPTAGPAWVVDTVNGDPSIGNTPTLPAVAGYPHLSVPMGQVLGLPVGLSIVGPQWADATVLAFGYAFEQKLGFVARPRFDTHLISVPALDDLFKPYYR